MKKLMLLLNKIFRKKKVNINKPLECLFKNKDRVKIYNHINGIVIYGLNKIYLVRSKRTNQYIKECHLSKRQTK